MKASTRRHRTSDRPLGKHRFIAPEDIDERYVKALTHLEQYHYFKYATAPWLHFVSDPTIEYSVFRKYLGYLRELQNHYIGCPAKQLESPNTLHKNLVYELRERGLNELIRRGIVPKRLAPNPGTPKRKSTRNSAFAMHRSNSYLHEIIVDLGYYWPLRYMVSADPALRLVDFHQLIQHQNVPIATREARDPLLIKLGFDEIRFDGTPHVIVRTRSDGVTIPVGIPGIQVDRGTETFAMVEKHLLHAIEFVEDRHYARHWGFDNCLIPFLFTEDVRKNRAKKFIRDQRGKCSFLLFQSIPDLGLERHFPKPQHYDRAYHYQDGEWVPPETIHIFTNPWERVGCPDFYLNTFEEVAA